MLGIFDSLFDYNGDGKLDSFERSMKWASINMAINHVKKAEQSKSNTGSTYTGSTYTGNTNKKSTTTGSGYRNIPAEDADECDSESTEYTSYVGGANNNATETDDASDVYDSYLRDELEMAGIDADEFEWMDEFEKKEVLEDAGLDPWDYDIY
ncbi:MAG: hypothetical protein LUE29_12065 [Lachnospiraceae bacterium]|nr:hypothetical protein [Lachnospiraceae bacterium]